ncbi:MAG: Uma2 family endonuclease [Rubritepida sp.]|nr:Uma2 family endonuclease [Rubritepida sp.]
MRKPPLRFETTAAYLDWAVDQDARMELWDGEVVLMAPERVGHARVKGAVFRALGDALRAAGSDCEALTDGVAVEVGRRSCYEPDALVQCGPRLDPDTCVATHPVIIVEVTSPSNNRQEMTRKFTDYFSLPSVQHYLILHHDRPLLLHHQRGDDGTIRTAFVTGGALLLDPPGITIDVTPLLTAD